MSNQALTWAYGLTLGSAPQKSVLLYLADRAQPDGTIARPSVATIVKATEFCESAVRKALSALEKRGLIRRGDQRHAALGREGSIIPANRRAVVWDLCMDVPLEDFQEAAQESSSTSRPDGGEAKDEQKIGDAQTCTTYRSDEDLTCTTYTPDDGEDGLTCTTYRSRGVPGTPKPSYKPIYPSTPTGYLPKAETAETDSDPENVLDALASMRRGLGLATPEPEERDVKAVAGLLASLDSSSSVLRPVERVLSVIRWIPTRSWWLKKVRTGRDLAARWGELADDHIVDTLTRQASPDAPRTRHTHTWACRHVLDALGLRDQGEAAEDLDAAVRKATELNQADGIGVVA